MREIVTGLRMKPILTWAMLWGTLTCVPSFAQETTAGLQGTVKDPSSSSVANATIELSSPALLGTKKTQSDETGKYRFSALPPGEYTITVTAAGFRTAKLTGIA